MDKKILLSTSYFGPISYYSKFLLPLDIWIEKHEHFIKQSYRNRSIIYGANGPVSLTIPVKRGSFHKIKIAELEIDYSKNWQINHWRAIESAYNSAPFFQYYSDDIKIFFETDTRLLFEHNLNIIKTILKLIHLPGNISFTDKYLADSAHSLDYRMNLRPKNSPEDPLFKTVRYFQVFDDSHGFIPDLSILDLLFNAGPETLDILRKTIKA